MKAISSFFFFTFNQVLSGPRQAMPAIPPGTPFSARRLCKEADFSLDWGSQTSQLWPGSIVHSQMVGGSPTRTHGHVCPCLGKDPPLRVRIDKISLGMIAHSWKLMTILLSAQAYRSFLDLVFSRDQPPYSVRKSYTHLPFSSIVTIFCWHRESVASFLNICMEGDKRALHSDFRRRNTTCVFVRNVYAAFNVRGRR